MSGKTYASVKKVSLEGVSEGWDDSCFAYVTPANFAERKQAMSFKSDDPLADDSVTFQDKLVRDHFVSGTIKVFDGQTFTDAPLTAEDAAGLPDVSNKLTMFILGYDIDPKDLSSLLASQLTTSTTSPTDTLTTATTSSEDSQPESQETSETNSSPSATKVD